MFWRNKFSCWRGFLRQSSFVFLFFVIIVCPVRAEETKWLNEKGEHFVVYFQSRENTFWIKDVLRSADRYYDSIAALMGYARYQDFWSWDERVKIIIYDSQEIFLKVTGQPEWSKGGALRDKYFLKSRVIVTFKQEEEFLTGVLPHEISHLMLQDYIGNDKSIPIWFNEGMAQLQEKERPEISDHVMRSLIRQNFYIPLNLLFTSDIRFQTDERHVLMFYAESVSLLDFLIKKYGHTPFRDFCQKLREGKDFEKALLSAYNISFDSLEDLEKKWLRYMQN